MADDDPLNATLSRDILSGLALQLAVQLPERRDEALKVLEILRKIVDEYWRQQAS